MPDVRLPDGTIIENVPEGTTKEQLIAKLEASGRDVSGLRIEAPSAPVIEAEQPTVDVQPQETETDDGILDRLQRQLGLTVRAGTEGVTALPSLLAEPIRQGLNLIPGVEIMPSQQAVSQLLTESGVPSPETEQERIVGAGASALAGGALPIGAGKSLVEIAPTIAKVLVASPGLQAISAAAGGGASQFAAEEGAGTGGQLAAGVAAGILAPTAAGITRAGVNAVKMPFTAIKAASKPAPQQAQRSLAKALEDDGVSVNQAITKIKEIGPEAMVSDLGENVSSLARRVESVPGLAKQIATRELSERQLNRNQRVTEAIKQSLGDGDDFFRTMDDINLIRKTASAPKYEEAYRTPVQMTDEIRDLFNRPSMIEAWKKAKTLSANEGGQIPADIKITPDGVEVINTPSMRTFDFIKRGLDDVLAKPEHTDDFGRIKTQLGRSIVGIKQKLVDALDIQNPAYKEARSTFSGHSDNIFALNKGRGFLRDDSEITASVLKSMGQSEKEMFRLGAARAIRDKILSAPDGADAYKRIFGNDIIREKLKTVFPTDESFKEFARIMQAEKVMTATRQKVMGGSPTERIRAEREAAGFEPRAAESIARGDFMTATINQAKEVMEKLKTPDEDVANQLAGMLFTRDPDANIKVLQGLEAAIKDLPQQQQQSFSKAIIKAMASQQANIAAQVQSEEIQ